MAEESGSVGSFDSALDDDLDEVAYAIQEAIEAIEQSPEAMARTDLYQANDNPRDAYIAKNLIAAGAASEALENLHPVSVAHALLEVLLGMDAAVGQDHVPAVIESRANRSWLCPCSRQCDGVVAVVASCSSLIVVRARVQALNLPHC